MVKEIEMATFSLTHPVIPSVVLTFTALHRPKSASASLQYFYSSDQSLGKHIF